MTRRGTLCPGALRFRFGDNEVFSATFTDHLHRDLLGLGPAQSKSKASRKAAEMHPEVGIGTDMSRSGRFFGHKEHIGLNSHLSTDFLLKVTEASQKDLFR